MSNALMMAIIATLHPVPAVATGIVPVGSKATSQNAVVDSGVTSQTVVCDLPAGCAVGDTVVLSCGANAAGQSYFAGGRVNSEGTLKATFRFAASDFSYAPPAGFSPIGA